MGWGGNVKREMEVTGNWSLPHSELRAPLSNRLRYVTERDQLDIDVSGTSVREATDSRVR